MFKWLKEKITSYNYNVIGSKYVVMSGSGPATLSINEPAEVSIPWLLPRRPEHFTGREEDLKELLEALQPKQVVALCGPGGIGKSALAAEAVWQLKSSNKLSERFPDGVIFHSFYNQPQAESALEHIAHTFKEDIGQGTRRDAARRALAGRQTLLILDGAEDADNLPKVLEIAGGCGVLITSRNRRDAQGGRRQDLAPLPIDDAVALLQAWGKTRATDRAASQQICELVGRLPLAVRLVGSYLDETEEEATDYLSWLKKTPLQALNRGQRRIQSVPLLLQRSLEQVEKTTHQILAVVGLLALAPFDRQIVATALGMSSGQVGPLLGELVRYGFLLRESKDQSAKSSSESSKSNRYEVTHALIHTYARQKMTPTMQMVRQAGTHYTTLVEEQSDIGLEGYKHLDSERVHIISILTSSLQKEEWEWESTRSLAWATGKYLDIQGHWAERVNAMEAGLQAVRHLGERQEEEAFLDNLGDAYSKLGRMTEAIEHYQQGLTISQEIGDRRAEGILINHLGDAYRKLGQVTQSITYHKQALVISREVEDKPSEANALGDLGSSYYSLGEYEQAKSYHHEALNITRQIGDRRSESSQLNHLGNTYRELGQRENARDYFQQALNISEEIGDRFSEETILGNLGIVYSRLGQPEQAISHYEEALAIARQTGNKYGQNRHLGNLGAAYRTVGKVDRAIELIEEALKIARQIEDKRSESNKLALLGFVYRARGEMELAIDYFNQALETANEIGNRLGYARQLDNLAEIYFAVGRLDEAVRDGREAVEIANELGVPREICFHGLTLGWALIAADKIDEALVVLKTAAEQDIPQANHQASVALGVAQLRANDTDAASLTFNQAIKRADTLLKDSPNYYKGWFTVALARAGLALIDMLDLTSAIEAYNQACQIISRSGVLERQLRLIDELDPLDQTGMLVAVREVLTRDRT